MADKDNREYANEALGVRFTLPNKPNVFQQLAFRGASAVGNGGLFVRFWNGALELIGDWECDKIPNPRDLVLDEEDDPAIADIVQFVGNTTAGHLTRINAIPKNV